MNAVPAGARANVDDGVARPGCPGPKNPVGPDHPQTEGVDQDIAVIAGVEVHLAADRRHADAVAVAADTGHHAPEQIGGARVVRRAKAQRVERGDRPGTHGKHIAQNAAHAGGRAVMGFDERGMVVALDLEHHGQPVADIDNARVFTRTLENGRTRGRQLGQQAP